MMSDNWQIVVHHSQGRQVITLGLNHAVCCTIGRDPQNTIVIKDNYVSRYHATLQVVHTRIYLGDLNSRNGSFVNGRRIITPTPLGHGDRLRCGQTELDVVIPVPCRSSPHPTDDTVPSIHPVLTPSEEKVFWQVVQGFTNKEIGKRLQISPRTVQTHLSSIMTKLTLENRSQIVRFAFEHQFRLPSAHTCN
jgi:pSer/pThr/pTyr-binding forkhead associated (FHA) protein